MDDWRWKKDWIECSNCRYYRRAAPSARCDHPDNLSSNWIGTVYMNRPDSKNHSGKCEWYEEKDANS